MTQNGDLGGKARGVYADFADSHEFFLSTLEGRKGKPQMDADGCR
jgi:hypothetical protein